MKLSEILKDWPKKMEELDETEIYNLMIEHCPELCPRSNETGMELQQGIKAIRKGKNFIKAISALTSCDREIDREALAEELEYLRNNFIAYDRNHLIEHFISTMPTWLKRIKGVNMKEYADLSHLSIIELIQLRSETVKANFPEDKDFIVWIDKEIKNRAGGYGRS